MANKMKWSVIMAVSILIVIGIFSVQERNPSHALGYADFADVKQDYWASPYIDFSAANDIINGYQLPDGTYRFLPENPVTKEESLTMLYRTLSAAGMLKSEEDFSAEYEKELTENQVAVWAQRFVAYGLKFDLLTEKDLTDFTDEKGAGIPAQREQVALWTAKALEKNLAPAYSLIYGDKDNISEEILPYIDLLYRQAIMQGDNAKMFYPSSNIKRAEFAAICKRVFESAKNENYSEEKELQSYRGTIVSIDTYNKKIMMTQSDGSGRVIQINPKTQIVIDGKVNYNGVVGIETGLTAVVAWGAFYLPDRSASDAGVLQLHIDTKVESRTGLLTNIEKLDESTFVLKIENEDGDIICYILNKNSETESAPKKGTEVTFIADGIKILEMK